MVPRNLRGHRITFVAVIAAAACGIDATGRMTADDAASPDGGGTGSGTKDGGTQGPSGDAQQGDDAGSDPDAPEGDAAMDAAFDTGADTGVDAGFTYECPSGAAVTSCASCSGRPTPCVFCNDTNAAQLRGMCLPSSQACYYNAPSGYGVCRCANDVSQCPAVGAQVCNSFDNGYCQPCGDQYSNGFPCRASGTCNSSSKTCQ